jgi:hypothetical protein
VPDADGVDLMAWVCDWTHWQGVVLPAGRVADEGYAMVKIKAGGAQREGRFFEDPMFYQNAVALVNEPRLLPAAYWYLMPGRASAQAALFFDLLDPLAVSTWHAFLDVEQPGLTWHDVRRFADAWFRLTMGQSLALYTSKRFWATLGVPVGERPAITFLEEAHWVNETTRNDVRRPYASQQAKAIDPAWWDVNYGGWQRASMIQFTDTALVAGVRTVASLYRGTKDQLREALST